MCRMAPRRSHDHSRGVRGRHHLGHHRPPATQGLCCYTTRFSFGLVYNTYMNQSSERRPSTPGFRSVAAITGDSESPNRGSNPRENYFAVMTLTQFLISEIP